MEFDKISSVIVDESDNMVYISDPDTYELLYLNRAIIEEFGIDGDYRGKKCHKVLQGLEEPCAFCTNQYLNSSHYYVWKHYNSVVKKYYELMDKLVMIDGKHRRMEIATDITAMENEHKDLERELSIEEKLVECIHTLSENTEINTAIDKLLGIIGKFYEADRAYIFEIDFEDEIVSNTYEWCKDGVTPQIDNLQSVPIEAIDRWLAEFNKKSQVYINSLDRDLDPESSEYQILKAQEIDVLLASPFKEKGEIKGFIGVDNPTCGLEQRRLLNSVTYFIENDISKRSIMAKLEDLSYRDMLTGLGNRNLYIETIDNLQKKNLRSLGVVFIDINGLKNANDKYGHQYGDKIIQNVAWGLRSVFPEYAYRIGGDEFVALSVDGEKKAFEDRLLRLRRFEKEECICDFSIGVNYCQDHVDVRGQIGYSDNMMYVEKQVYYGNTANEINTYHEALARELVEEIKKNLFDVYLQPKISIETGELAGAEALVRKHVADGGLITPSYFIPLYEAEGVIQYLDVFVFEEVCKMLHGWQQKGYRQMPVSVNFSRISLMGMDIVKRLTDIRDRYGIPWGMITLEVTESISKMGTAALKELLDRFAMNGIDFSLDDYGARYSNLEILTKLKFKELKIDKSLMDDIVENERTRVVLSHSIRMCRELGIVVAVAEGIETEEQLDILKEFHCDVGQGYLFSRPLSIDGFLEKYGEKYIY